MGGYKKKIYRYIVGEPKIKVVENMELASVDMFSSNPVFVQDKCLLLGFYNIHIISKDKTIETSKNMGFINL